MSLQYSNTTTKRAILQEIESELGFNYGDITGNADLKSQITSSINLAHDDLLDIGFKNSGTWQLDDTNHDDDYPYIYANLVSGQRGYVFLEDETGNLILDFHRVMAADPTGLYRQLDPVDMQTSNNNQVNTDSFIDGRDQTGTPTRYEKTSNGILLDLVPSYNYTRGLKVFINREGSYFTTSDTTKKPGVPGLLHRWYVIRPSLDYARRNSLKCHDRLALEVEKFEKKIASTFGKRERDTKRRLVANRESNK